MVRKYLYGLPAFVLAFGILSVSLLRSSSQILAFNSPNPSPTPTPPDQSLVDYTLPFPGRVLPGTVLWPLKAMRDKLWYFLAASHLSRAEAALLFSDKRLVAGDEVFKSGNIDLSVSVIDKAEKYLEIAANQEKEARSDGIDTTLFLTNLASSSLKHREVIERHLASGAPAEVKVHLSKTVDYSKAIYRDSSEALEARGKESPKSPFDGD